MKERTHLVPLILGPALGLVHGLTLRLCVALHLLVADLDQRRPTDLHHLLNSRLFHAEVTALLEGLFTLLTLIGLVLSHIGRVTFLNKTSSCMK